VTAEEFALLISHVTSARDAFGLALMRYCALHVGQVVTLKRDRVQAMPHAVHCPSEVASDAAQHVGSAAAGRDHTEPAKQLKGRI
jgi:hypothetical protein